MADIRRNLQRDDRFDVLEWTAAESGGLTRGDMEEQAESLRDVVSVANGSGSIVALVIVVLGCLVMALQHLPKPAAMPRWPGITLMMGGGVCLIAGFVLNSTIPGRIRDAVTDAVYHSPDVPVTAMDLAGDLAESFTRQATAGCHRDGHWGSTYRGISAVRPLPGSGWTTAPSWKSPSATRATAAATGALNSGSKTSVSRIPAG